MKRLASIITATMCMMSDVEAAQKYALNNETRVSASISKTQINRIQVENDRIAAVYGGDDGFEILTDEIGGQLFVKYKTVDTDPVFLTVVTEDDLVQDLKLTPESIEAQTIILKQHQQKGGSSINGSGVETTIFSQKIISVIQKMAKGVPVIADAAIPHDLDSSNRNPDVSELKEYDLTEDDFIGKVFLIKNATKQQISLTHNLIKNAQKDQLKLVAFAVEKEVIAPNEAVYCFVVISKAIGEAI